MANLTGVAAIHAITRSTSLQVIASFGHMQGATCGDGAERKGPIYGHWLSLILLAGYSFRETLRVYYSLPTITQLVELRLGLAPGAAPASLKRDFPKEYLNLVAGTIKRHMGAASFDGGLSLPVSTRGLDSIFPGARVHADKSTQVWTIRTACGPLVCENSIEVLDEAGVAAITFDGDVAPPPVGEMEFL